MSLELLVGRRFARGHLLVAGDGIVGNLAAPPLPTPLEPLDLAHHEHHVREERALGGDPWPASGSSVCKSAVLRRSSAAGTDRVCQCASFISRALTPGFPSSEAIRSDEATPSSTIARAPYHRPWWPGIGRSPSGLWSMRFVSASTYNPPGVHAVRVLLEGDRDGPRRSTRPPSRQTRRGSSGSTPAVGGNGLSLDGQRPDPRPDPRLPRPPSRPPSTKTRPHSTSTAVRAGVQRPDRRRRSRPAPSATRPTSRQTRNASMHTAFTLDASRVPLEQAGSHLHRPTHFPLVFGFGCSVLVRGRRAALVPRGGPSFTQPRTEKQKKER